MREDWIRAVNEHSQGIKNSQCSYQVCNLHFQRNQLKIRSAEGKVKLVEKTIPTLFGQNEAVMDVPEQTISSEIDLSPNDPT